METEHPHTPLICRGCKKPLPVGSISAFCYDCLKEVQKTLREMKQGPQTCPECGAILPRHKYTCHRSPTYP